MNSYYEHREKALKHVTPDNQSIVCAILALAEQVRGLRVDLCGDQEDER
jgi:hypothetical protein